MDAWAGSTVDASSAVQPANEWRCYGSAHRQHHVSGKSCLSRLLEWHGDWGRNFDSLSFACQYQLWCGGDWQSGHTERHAHVKRHGGYYAELGCDQWRGLYGYGRQFPLDYWAGSAVDASGAVQPGNSRRRYGPTHHQQHVPGQSCLSGPFEWHWHCGRNTRTNTSVQTIPYGPPDPFLGGYGRRGFGYWGGWGFAYEPAVDVVVRTNFEAYAEIVLLTPDQAAKEPRALNAGEVITRIGPDAAPPKPNQT